MNTTDFLVRCYTHQELSKLYRVSWKTFKKLLKPYSKQIGQKNGHFYTSKQVMIIIKRLGLPSSPVAQKTPHQTTEFANIRQKPQTST
jgi:hypothetical protein